MSAQDSAHFGSYKPTSVRTIRVDHSRQSAEHSRHDAKLSESSKRDTDHYRQSPVADGVNETDRESSSTRTTRQKSRVSSSSSDYSDDHTDFSTTAPLSISKVTRRSKVPSDGGSDRRRLAIVQMDSLEDPPPIRYKKDDQSRNIKRRGAPSDLAGLALVAPPDAAPSSYTQLTPITPTPTTADVIIQNAAREKTHRKVASDVTTNTDREFDAADQRGSATSKEMRVEPQINVVNDSLNPPCDEQPPKSPSPNGVSDASHQAHESLTPTPHAKTGMIGNIPNSLITTPEIGEKKDVSIRVAAPVVINLESARPFKRKDNTSRNDSPVQPASAGLFSSQEKSAYIHYEPGVHSTAGPLPPLPPPRAMFNVDVNSPAPPRPPRHNSPVSSRPPRGDIEAVKKALQLPSSVTAALASRTPKPSTRGSIDSPESKVALLQDSQPEVETTSTNTSVKSVHRREGAFSPSLSTSTMTSASDVSATQTTMTSEGDHPHGDVKVSDDSKTSDDHISGDDTVPPITVIKPMQLVEKQDGQEEHAVSTDMISSPISRRRISDDLSERSHSRSPLYQGHTRDTPSPPPKSFRNSLTTNLKRLSSSLPRTPSLSSKSHRSSGTYYSSRTPSPPMYSNPLPPPRPKIVSSHPPAMLYAEISTKRTSLERSMLYAQKINELYMYDSGLGDWTIEAKQRANNNRPTVAFSSHTFTPQPRHTSRSSIISEVSFPRRPDASTATDLTVKSTDLVPAAPPALPYPSLANTMYPARSPSMANTPPGSIRSLASSSSGTKSSGGFFASLGRKSSMTSSKKPGLPQITTNQPARVLTKPPPASAVPRIINIVTSPVVPGGPRAIPNRRAARSQTLVVTTNSFVSNSPNPERNEVLGRRPSLFDLTSSSEPAAVIDIAPDPEFIRQVDKLAHLLPDADRGVLAGYLRRAGQDILAIGQYLEDEKNGTIKPP